jgi:simple sugar transport system ATP-binding protein
VLCGGKVNGILDGRTAKKEEVGLRMTKLQNDSAPKKKTAKKSEEGAAK